MHKWVYTARKRGIMPPAFADGSSSHKAAAAGGDEGGLKNNMALSAEVWLVTPISRDLLYIPMAPDLG